MGAVWLFAGRIHAADEPAPRALDHVRLQLKWVHQFQFAGYYAAIEQGYYRKAGLDVELIEAQPDVNPVNAVLEGKAEFGVGTSSLLLERAHGKPVVVLGVVYQHSPLILISRNDTGISDIHDLVGKPIMIDAQGADIYAYFNAEGVDSSKLNVLPQQFDLRTLINGKVAATSAYSTDEPFQLRVLGVGFTEFSPREGGVDFYGDNLFTTEEQIKDYPERVRAFRAASFQGWSYALAHKEEMVDLIERKYNRGRSRPQLLFEAQQTERLMHPDLIEVGYMNPGRWQHIQNTFEEQGLLPKPIDLKPFLYDPNPKPNLKLLYGLLMVLAVIAIGALFWLLPLMYLARKRRLEIERRILIERKLLSSMERTEEALAAQSRFLAVLSHEVRSPIGGISRLLELILLEQKAHLPASLNDDLHVLQQSAQSLYQLVDGLLEWSRCEADGVELELATIQVKPFVEDLQKLFMPLAETKKLAFSCSVGVGVPGAIRSDELRLRQIISNLLANAIKFTDKGAVTLIVEQEAEAAPGSPCRMLFAVKDTGIGIPAGAMGRLFKPYTQVDSSIARKFGGTGLGLSISLHFAKLLGGKITVKSEPDHGSTFTLEIMAEAVTEASPVAGMRDAPANRSATAGG